MKRFYIFNTKVPTVGKPSPDPTKAIKIWGHRYEMPVLHAKQDIICWKRNDGLHDCELQLAEMVKEEEVSEFGNFTSRNWYDIVQRVPIGTFSDISISDPCMQKNFRYKGTMNYPKEYHKWKKEWEMEPREGVAAEITGDVNKRFSCDMDFKVQGKTTSVNRENWVALILQCEGEEGKTITCRPMVKEEGYLRRDEMTSVKNITPAASGAFESQPATISLIQ